MIDLIESFDWSMKQWETGVNDMKYFSSSPMDKLE